MSENSEQTQESFEAHFLKLERLSNDLQENRVSIDELIPRMKEALDSIKICKSVLDKTKHQLNEIRAEFESLKD